MTDSVDRSLPPLQSAYWPDVERSPRRLLLWPIGSTEQHGPHLPLGTDTIIAAQLAERARQVLPDTAVAPALPLGASGEHRHFPGTLSIGSDALQQVVVEFVRHASTHWHQVLIVNAHGGNFEALENAAEQLAYEQHNVAVYHASSAGPRADAHAGYRETSLLLHLAPERVRLSAAIPGANEPISRLLPALRTEGVRSVSPTGVLGDPSGATAEAGRDDFENLLESLLMVARALLEHQ